MRNIRHMLWALAAALLLLGGCGNQDNSDASLFAAEGEEDQADSDATGGLAGEVVCEMVCDPECQGQRANEDGTIPDDEKEATDPATGQRSDDCCYEVCKPVEPPCTNEMRCDQECVAAYSCLGWDEQAVMAKCCDQRCRPDDKQCYEVERCDEDCLANLTDSSQPEGQDDLRQQCCQVELICEEPPRPCEPTTGCCNDADCCRPDGNCCGAYDNCCAGTPGCCTDNCCGAQGCCGGSYGCCKDCNDRCNRCGDDGRCCATDDECPNGRCGSDCDPNMAGCCDPSRPDGNCEPPPPPPEPCTNEDGRPCCDSADGSCERPSNDCTDENGERKCDADGNCWC